MQMGDCFQFPMALLQSVVDEIISDQKRLQEANQQFHHPLQPKGN